MAHFRKIGASDHTGYDEDRTLQVLPVARQTTFYLVAGAGLDVSVDDDSLVSLNVGDTDEWGAHRSAELTAWEKEQVLRKIKVTAKNSEGWTTMRAKLGENEYRLVVAAACN